jgi:hypothetical protein
VVVIAAETSFDEAEIYELYDSVGRRLGMIEHHEQGLSAFGLRVSNH